MSAVVVRLDGCAIAPARTSLDELHALLTLDPICGALPSRTLFVSSPQAKARLARWLSPGDAAAARTSLACALVAYDFPLAVDVLAERATHGADARRFAIRIAARSAALQGPSLVAASRAIGLQARPIAHFDACGLRREFFAASAATVVFASLIDPSQETCT